MRQSSGYFYIEVNDLVKRESTKMQKFIFEQKEEMDLRTKGDDWVCTYVSFISVCTGLDSGPTTDTKT